MHRFQWKKVRKQTEVNWSFDSVRISLFRFRLAEFTAVQRRRSQSERLQLMCLSHTVCPSNMLVAFSLSLRSSCSQNIIQEISISFFETANKACKYEHINHLNGALLAFSCMKRPLPHTDRYYTTHYFMAYSHSRAYYVNVQSRNIYHSHNGFWDSEHKNLSFCQLYSRTEQVSALLMGSTAFTEHLPQCFIVTAYFPAYEELLLKTCC